MLLRGTPCEQISKFTNAKFMYGSDRTQIFQIANIQKGLIIYGQPMLTEHAVKPCKPLNNGGLIFHMLLTLQRIKNVSIFIGN